MVNKSRLELSVGLFILVGLVIMVFLVFFIRDFQIVKPGYNFQIIYCFANGIKVGAPVRLAGVDVGEVKSMDIFFDRQSLRTKVKVRVWVRKDAHIPFDSKFWINTLGLLGEKYLEIIPGSDQENLVLKEQSVIGQDPVAMEEITENTKKLVLKLNDTLAEMNDVLAKVKSGEGTIGKLMNDAAVYKNIEELTEDLKRHPWKLFWKTKEKIR